MAGSLIGKVEIISIAILIVTGLLLYTGKIEQRLFENVVTAILFFYLGWQGRSIKRAIVSRLRK